MYLLVLDVNRFKKINDEHGHAQGDLALKAIANCLKESCIEKSDFIARYGGDEFVIVYKGNDVEGLCQRIHTYIYTTIIFHVWSRCKYWLCAI